jgi:CBS domain-containing protein
MDVDFFDPESDDQAVKEDLNRDDLLYRVSNYKYTKKLAELMVHDVFTCSHNCSVVEAAREMTRRKISSVVVVDSENRPTGIVTERDMVGNIITKDICNIGDVLISEIMTPNPVCLNSDDTLFNALSIFSKYKIKHLPVLSEGKVAGILTFRQIVKIRHYDPLVLIGKIEEAGTTGEYREIKESMVDMVFERLSSKIDPAEILCMLSTINASIHKSLADRVMDELGEEPPVEFSLFITGSHGRRENLLFPDQDFGIIIDDYDDRYLDQNDRYFLEFSQRLSDYLYESGYPYCTGNIMGTNPNWRKRLFEWKIHLKFILNGFSRESIRYTTLIYDSAHLFGEAGIFNSFKSFAMSEISKHHDLLRTMHLDEEAVHRVPLSFFSRFITEKDEKHKGEIDMKRSGLIFIIEAVRLLALRHGIKDTSTLDRLDSLVKAEVLNENDAEYFENAYRVILQHTLRAQVENYRKTGTGSYFINPNSLSPRKKRILKSSFKAISRLQELVGSDFGELVI